MIEVNSFAELRTSAPGKAGDMAFLKRYYDKDSSFRGGGWFVGFPQTSGLPSDDGGITAVDTNKKFYWRRVINDPKEITIFHFGGKCDGKTDDTDAFTRNFMWMKSYDSYSDSLGVLVPTGKIFLKPIDLTSLGEIPIFALYGDTRAKSGWRPRVRIISDKSNGTVFKVNARRVILEGFTWDGQCTADTTKNKGAITPEMRSNNQPFFENICQAGEFIGMNCVRVERNGGDAFKFLDTLDTKLMQIYSSNTYGAVFNVGWSGNKQGNWDHSTAIALKECNFQNGFGPGTLVMPRLTQGLIENVWIEHTRFPGDLTNGQWNINALSIESSDNPIDFTNSRVTINGIYFQTGGAMTLANGPGRWLSGYERGSIRQETYGIQMTDASFRAGYYTGYKLTNITHEDKWFYVGDFSFPKMNQVWEIEFLSKRDGTAATAKLEKPSEMGGMGRRVITLQRCSSPAKVYADMKQEGEDAIVDVVYQRLWGDHAKVFVKLAKDCGDVVFNLTTTGPTRFEAGVCTLFSEGPCECIGDQLAEMTTSVEKNQKDYARPQNRFSLHNGLAGIGANEQGVLTMQTVEGKAPKDPTKPAGYTTININGVDRVVPYY